MKQKLMPKNLILLVIAYFFFNPLKAQLAGNYTIDAGKSATTTNYKSFGSAIEDMMLGTRADGGTPNGSGVNGAVFFSVANGTYQEQVQINVIPGASAKNPITFQSASGDSSKVILDFPASNSVNGYALKLNSADYLTFKQISVTRSGTNYFGTAIEFSNSASHNSFINCVIAAAEDYAPSNVGSSAFYSYNSADTSLLIKNCYIKNGSYGINFYISNSNGKNNPGTVIEGCLVENAYTKGIEITGRQGLIIHGNKVFCRSGIYVALSNNIEITNNHIECLFGRSEGLLISEVNGSDSKPSVIANNIIHAIETGIALLSAENCNIVYNTVLTEGYLYNNGSGTAFFNTNTSSLISEIKLLNNIFVNAGTSGRIMYFGAPVRLSDYNLYYHKNKSSISNILVYFNGRQYLTIEDYQQASFQDKNSWFANPQFIGSKDFHTRSYTVNEKAKPLSYITTDYDGETRSFLHPDIGADEYKPGLDISLKEFIPTAAPYCDTITDVKARIYNNGTTKLDSLKITYILDKDTVSAGFYKIGLIADTDTILHLSKLNLTRGGQFLKVFLSLPDNNIKDSFAHNDTITVKQRRSLNGTYTIGAKNADFTGFTAAINDLLAFGICGPVNFNVKDGKYYEKAAITPVPGASAASRITFQSESGDSAKVTLISNTGLKQAVYLHGASFVTFKNLGIEMYYPFAYEQGSAVVIDSNASNNVFSGCKIYNYSSGSAAPLTTNIVIINASKGSDSANAFLDNYIAGGFTSFKFTGLRNSYANKHIIQGNKIHPYAKILDAQYLDSFVFADNTVNMNGISGYDLMSLNNLATAYITGNQVYSKNARQGLYINSLLAKNSRRGLIANNMISVGASNALDIVDIQNYDIVYNSIRNTNPPLSTATIAYVNATGIYSNGNNKLFNNIFEQSNNYGKVYISPGAVKYGIFSQSDNNNYYAPLGITLYWDGNANSSVSSFSASSGMDSNSISTDPKFFSSTDLHSNASGLAGKGKAIKEAVNDIDGDLRHTAAPDIGADEFSPAENDIKIVSIIPYAFPACGSNPVFVKVKNTGTKKLDSAKFTLLLNGITQYTGYIKLNLFNGKDTTLKTDSITIVSLNTWNTIKVIATDPNSRADGKPFDNSAEIKAINSFNGTYTVGGPNSEFSDLHTAIASLKKQGICGAVTLNLADNIYKGQHILPFIPGASAQNTITVKSAGNDSTKVVLFHNVDNESVIIIDSGQHYIVKGITIKKTTKDLNCRAVTLEKIAMYNTFENCRIEGITYLRGELVANGNTFNGGHNTFKNNYLKGGYMGFSFRMAGNDLIDGMSFINNTIDSVQSIPVSLAYNKNFTVVNNKITHTITGEGTSYAININGCEGKQNISANYIMLNAGGNKNAYYIGIYLAGSACPDNERGIVANNMICGIGKQSISGMTITNIKNYDIVHNSVNLSSTASSQCLFLTSGDTGRLAHNRVLNNVFSNQGAGVAVYYMFNSFMGYDEFDYNNYYITSKARGIATDYLGNHNFAQFKANTGFDSNSISVNPNFKSNTDLHTTGATLNHKGKPVDFVKTDYDDEQRGCLPDIGADETVYSKDAAVINILSPGNGSCGDSSTPVIIVVENMGDESIDNIPFSVSISGAINKAFFDTIQYALAPCQRDTIILKQPVNTYAGGTYTIKAGTNFLADEEKTNNSTELNIKIKSKPLAPKPQQVIICGPAAVKLNSQLSGAFTNWYVSDTSKTPIWTGHEFTTGLINATTTYFVSYVTDSCEGPRSEVKIIYTEIPEAKFTLQNACVNSAVTIENKTPNDSAFTYAWDFGDNTTQSIFEPVHIWQAAGKYTVKLTVENKYNCKDTFTHDITIYPLPKAPAVKDTNVCGPNKAKLTAKGYTGRLRWYDTDTSRQSIFEGDTLTTAILQSNSIYYVSTISANGCESGRVPLAVKVISLPDAGFLHTNACKGETIYFSNTSKDTQNIKFTWYFGDGNTSNNLHTSHIFSKTGAYKVQLVAMNAGNCFSSAEKTVIINPEPVADFSVVFLQGRKVKFILQDSTYNTYSWKFGDGNTSSQKEPEHTYSHDGMYSISLMVKDSNECVSVKTMQVSITNLSLPGNVMAETGIQVFPNPFSNYTEIKYSVTNSAKALLILTDINGKTNIILEEKAVNTGIYSYKLIPEKYNLSAGVYFVKALIGDTLFIRKIVLVK